MNYTTVVGLEVHVQLQTATKLFCGCLNKFNPDNPNVQTCPVCLGLPGALPVMNRRAYELAVKTAIALNCNIAEFTKWDRKQYYYPDLPKAYQISQYDLPFSSDGWLEIEIDDETGETKRIGIIRAHLEEDAGKNIHDETGGNRDSRVDLNRCGTPLVEIVSQPDLSSAEEARIYLEDLRRLLKSLEVSDCNMQEGSLRCDANVNIHVHTDDGKTIATPLVEIKNLNSFRNVEMAIEYEAVRQFQEWQETGKTFGEVLKRTFGWNADRGFTFEQRMKEEASDYRYFPDPDLMPVTITSEQVGAIQQTVGESPVDMRKRFQEAYELSRYDASVIIDQGKSFSRYFESVGKKCGNGKSAANWTTQDVLRELNERKIEIELFPVTDETLGILLHKIELDEITVKSAREVFEILLAEADAGKSVTPARVDAIIDEKNLRIVSDTGELEKIINEVLRKNEQIVADFRGGKQGAIGPLIGQVMRQVGAADAKVVREIIVRKID